MGVNSQLHDVCIGVPKGSILGPRLFNLYTYDINNNLPDDAFILQYDEEKQILLSVNKSTSLNSIE